ncbi:MAG: mandelate racemase/muconate lactonizing enzyme family protein, partial [Thermomicrobiales bacterium]
MKIRSVDAFGLRGGTPEGGWTNELTAESSVHTLIRVTTDEGLVGWGSVFTSGDLVRASLQVLAPLLIGESAIEPERVSETLHQHTFWQGRGGAITHTISGIDIAL